jgi:hypothetical protein
MYRRAKVKRDFSVDPFTQGIRFDAQARESQV